VWPCVIACGSWLPRPRIRARSWLTVPAGVLVAGAALGQLGIEVGQHGPQPGDPLGQMSVRGAITAGRGEIIDLAGEPAK
jgi:hypothetical protein